MKKMLLIMLSCLFILSACGKKGPNIVYVSEEEARDKLFEVGNQVYEKKEYKTYKKVNGMYFISINELRNTLGYDINEFQRVQDKKCDLDATGIYVDEDNISKTPYAGAPIKANVVCE